MSTNRERLALQAYYKLLQSKGADSSLLAQRRQLLAELVELLAEVSTDSASYRAAVDQCLEHKPAAEWPQCLLIIREFYPFWRGDVRAVMQYADTVGFELHPIGWQPAVIDLQSVWPALQQEQFTTPELWAINGYVKALQTLDKLEIELELRTRMAKLMVLRLREAPAHEKNAYRITADATLPLFTLKHTRQIFLNAVRDFYYFWSGHPDAVRLISQQKPHEPL